MDKVLSSDEVKDKEFKEKNSDQIKSNIFPGIRNANLLQCAKLQIIRTIEIHKENLNKEERENICKTLTKNTLGDETPTTNELKENIKEVMEKYTIKEDLNKIFNNIKKEEQEKKKIRLQHPNQDDILISHFASSIGKIFNKKEKLFYHINLKEVVSINIIKKKTTEQLMTGFEIVTPPQFVTIIEQYITPFVIIHTKYQDFENDKSININVSQITLNSPQLIEHLQAIQRIFTTPIPIIKDKKLYLPKKGYDERFNSWLPENAIEINENITLDEATKTLKEIYSEFCFSDEQDKINAIAALLTPFLKGLYPSFNCRTPLFFYKGNRERAGKDYCANITGIVYEGQAGEEPPISTEANNNNSNEELRKKILSGMMAGQKRFHFANNKGHINNAVLEALITNKHFSDRVLGKNQIVSFPNETDISLSGNVGIGFTPDLANRSIFINLHLAIEDANRRKFEKPNLHGYVLKNRELILSCLYSLIKNWYNKNKPKGSVLFSSFPEWAEICGGIMESANLGNPCKRNKELLGLAIDTETSEMKDLFKLIFEYYKDSWIKKSDILNVIIENDMFDYLDFQKPGDKVKWALILEKFQNRILGDLILVPDSVEKRASRRQYQIRKTRLQDFDKKCV